MVWLRIYSGSGKFCKRCQTSPPHGETQEHLLLCSDLASRRNADNITLEISRIISADLSIDNDIHVAIILLVDDSISSGPVKTDEKVQALLDEMNSRPKHPQHPNSVRVILPKLSFHLAFLCFVCATQVGLCRGRRYQ